MYQGYEEVFAGGVYDGNAEGEIRRQLSEEEVRALAANALSGTEIVEHAYGPMESMGGE